MDAIAAHACVNLHLPPSAECIDAAVAYLKQFRSGLGRATLTLQELAIRSVIKNPQRFLAVHLDNADSAPSLENLPTPVSEKLLAAVESDLVLSQEDKHSLALLLANGSTNHLDYRRFRSNGKSLGSDTPFFMKLAFDCPNLKTLDVSHRVWKEFLEPGHCCLLKVIACKWKNLSVLCLDARHYKMDGVEPPFQDLGCRTMPCQGDSIIRAICRHLPRLRTLKATVPPLTCEDVDDLSQMQHLAYLKLDLFVVKTLRQYTNYDTPPEYVRHVDQLVHAAGRLPNLQKFDFFFRSDTFSAPYVEFVELFGRLYPNKKLILGQIWLQSNLLGNWPENLSVEELHTFGENPDLDWQAMLQIKGPIKKLSFSFNVPENDLYALLEKFGADITHLDFTHCSVGNVLNLHWVLFACKKLQNFKMKTNRSFVNGNFQIGPDHFKDCHKFWLCQRELSHPRDLNASTIELIKLYFLGSKHHLKRRVVSTSNDLEALIQTLEMNPGYTCLDFLEEIYFNVQFKPTLMLRDVTKALVLLMRRSPFLRKVAIFDHGNLYFPPNWLCSILQSVGITLNRVVNLKLEEDVIDPFENSFVLNECYNLHDQMAHKAFNVVEDGQVLII